MAPYDAQAPRRRCGLDSAWNHDGFEGENAIGHPVHAVRPDGSRCPAAQIGESLIIGIRVDGVGVDFTNPLNPGNQIVLEEANDLFTARIVNRIEEAGL